MGNYHQKKGKGKLPLFCGNGERVIPIFSGECYAFPLVLLSCNKKLEISIVRVVQKKFYWECEVKSSRKSIVEVVEGGLTHIQSQGYITYLFSDILRLTKGYEKLVVTS